MKIITTTKEIWGEYSYTTIFHHNVFHYATFKDGFLFRIFKVGLSFRDTKVSQPLFSERIGIVKTFKLWKYSIKFLGYYK